MASIRTAILAAALMLAPALACAETRLDARYAVTLAGITIGKGAWIVDIGEDQYTAAASGATTGLVRLFASGHGTSAVRGSVVNGRLAPATYAAGLTQDKKSDEVRMSLAGGNVKDFAIIPAPPPPAPERILVTEAHLRGVVDPVTASLVQIPGNGDPVNPEACNRGGSVFDGRIRYDLRLSYKRMERVKLAESYEGPVVVCAIYFTPIAGYLPGRVAIKYLAEQRDMEVWLAPIGGTRVLAPFRFSIPTPLGTGVLQATQFVTTQQPRVTPTRLGQ
jgi:Protein of unknown function (DUF3108)